MQNEDRKHGYVTSRHVVEQMRDLPLGLAALRDVSEPTARAGLTTSSLCSWFLPRIDGLMACTLDPYYHEPSSPEMQSVFLNKSPRSVGVGPTGVNGVIKCLLIKTLCRRT